VNGNGSQDHCSILLKSRAKLNDTSQQNSEDDEAYLVPEGKRLARFDAKSTLNKGKYKIAENSARGQETALEGITLENTKGCANYNTYSGTVDSLVVTKDSFTIAPVPATIKRTSTVD